jgi:chitin synthase
VTPNRHDVSWGTKGSDTAESLPSLSSKKAKEEDAPAVVDDTEKMQEDIDSAFKETVERAVKKVVVVEVAEQPTMDVSTIHHALPWLLLSHTILMLITYINSRL